MNQHQTIHTGTARGEPYEQLSVFLPASILRALRRQVPAGQRRAFIAHALRMALAEDARPSPTETPHSRP